MNKILRRWSTLISRCLVVVFVFNLFASALWAVENKQVAVEAPKPQSAYSKISDIYLTSLHNEDFKEKEEMKKTLEELDKAYNDMVVRAKFKDVKMPPVATVEKLRLVYSLFHGLDVANNDLPDMHRVVTNDNVFTDMQIFCGSISDLKHHVFGYVDRTQTSFGKVELQRFLYQDFDSLERLKDKIKQRQDIVRYLVENPSLCKKLEAQLEMIRNNEADLLWFWKALEFSVKKFMSMLYYQGFMEGLNESTPALEFLNLMQTVGVGFSVISMDIVYAAVVAILLIGASKTNNSLVLLGGAGYGALVAFLCIFATSAIIGVIKTNITLSNDFQTKLIGASAVSDATSNISHIIDKDYGLKTLWENVDALKVGASNKKFVNEDMRDLLQKLQAGTFKGEASFFSNKGRVLATFQKMLRLKDNFVKSLRAVGELDAYLSIAKLYREHADNNNATYCFPEIVESAEQPVIDAKGIWHPFIDVNKVVTNDVRLGAALDSHNVILTGPNAAGKSTYLKSLTISLLLAQCFGIAPATSFRFTPFAKINTYLNIADEEGRESLYQAEMRRAQELLNSIKGLKKGEFSFVIMDEIFTGTNPKEGKAGAYGVARSIANYPSCICVVASHYKRLTELEPATKGYFKNYKVYVNIADNGDVTCPYKVVPGISDQTIALLLLEKQGFDKEILDEAYKILNSSHR